MLSDCLLVRIMHAQLHACNQIFAYTHSGGGAADDVHAQDQGLRSQAEVSSCSCGITSRVSYPMSNANVEGSVWGSALGSGPYAHCLPTSHLLPPLQHAATNTCSLNMLFARKNGRILCSTGTAGVAGDACSRLLGAQAQFPLQTCLLILISASLASACAYIFSYLHLRRSLTSAHACICSDQPLLIPASAHAPHIHSCLHLLIPAPAQLPHVRSFLHLPRSVTSAQTCHLIVPASAQ
eukprot:1138987-Pelagomonas_calceolata.AAC.5